MEYALIPLPELTLREVRQQFVAYRKETYPAYGEGSLPCFDYPTFKAKTREYHDLNGQLAVLYGKFPQLATAPADIRAKLVQLEVRSSELEHELCLN